MDVYTFDALTRSAVASSTRRGTMRVLAGGVLGALLGTLGRGPAGAACHRLGRRCGEDGDCCGGARCRRGRCRCEPEKECLGNCCGRGKGCTEGVDPIAAGCCPKRRIYTQVTYQDGGPVAGPTVCCPVESVCGDECCDSRLPGTHAVFCATDDSGKPTCHHGSTKLVRYVR